MKKQYYFRLLITIVLLAAVALFALLGGRTETPNRLDKSAPDISGQKYEGSEPSNESAPETAAHSDQDTIITVVLWARIYYCYEVSTEGDLTSAMGEIRPLRVDVKSADDIEKTSEFEVVHLSDAELQQLIELVECATESYYSYKFVEVRDSYPVTLYYQGKEYHGFYTSSPKELCDLKALCDALIELSPMQIEFVGFA